MWITLTESERALGTTACWPSGRIAMSMGNSPTSTVSVIIEVQMLKKVTVFVSRLQMSTSEPSGVKASSRGMSPSGGTSTERKSTVGKRLSAPPGCSGVSSGSSPMRWRVGKTRTMGSSSPSGEVWIVSPEGPWRVGAARERTAKRSGACAILCVGERGRGLPNLADTPRSGVRPLLTRPKSRHPSERQVEQRTQRDTISSARTSAPPHDDDARNLAALPLPHGLRWG